MECNDIYRWQSFIPYSKKSLQFTQDPSREEEYSKNTKLVFTDQQCLLLDIKSGEGHLNVILKTHQCLKFNISIINPLNYGV